MYRVQHTRSKARTGLMRQNKKKKTKEEEERQEPAARLSQGRGWLLPSFLCAVAYGVVANEETKRVANDSYCSRGEFEYAAPLLKMWPPFSEYITAEPP
ncbi:hypothetical protein H6P81_000692 [Aristolochia fimbriata]|uniref:Uncharacterized protein n=1 Tax=Aristolochia fimbriata TaxID=158543 RepID=A0AAV7F693_ARIFI|nr:hypothetical protein H6P81_000692 [Aristolochia fimbriata]